MSSEQDKPELGKKFEAAFNEGLRELRKQFPSDNELAKHTGISQPTISKMLLGNQEPRLTAVSKILDKAGAEIVFPWSKRNETRRIAVEGFSGKAEEWKAVNRFVVEDGKVCMLEEIGAILPLAMLEELSPTLSLGVFSMPENASVDALLLHPNNSLLIDFSGKLDPEESAMFLVNLPDQGTVCAQASMNKHTCRRMLIYTAKTTWSPWAFVEEQDDMNLDDLVIGKIVYAMGAIKP